MGMIQKAAAQTPQASPQQQNAMALMNSFLDGNKMRARFDDLLGKRTPQFISSLVSMVNADKNLQAAFFKNPMSVIQCGLKAASFDLPIDPALGYAYIVPFGGSAAFILGWRGMHQLALRTGAYKTINVVDIREGELRSYNRLTEEADVAFYEDEDERERHEIIGYLGYYRLVNGAEKTVYMTVKAIEAHEKKFRKGSYQGKGWRDNWDAMARKTVYRQLIGKWGLMSISYQTVDMGQAIADDMAAENQLPVTLDPMPEAAPDPAVDPAPEALHVDEATGEVVM